MRRQQPAFSAQYERSWRVLPVSGGVPAAIFERARLFCERAGIERAFRVDRQRRDKESRVWLLFASRLAPGEAVESLRAESRELLLMAGKSINTASARMQGKTIGA